MSDSTACVSSGPRLYSLFVHCAVTADTKSIRFERFLFQAPILYFLLNFGIVLLSCVEAENWSGRVTTRARVPSVFPLKLCYCDDKYFELEMCAIGTATTAQHCSICRIRALGHRKRGDTHYSLRPNGCRPINYLCLQTLRN